MTSQRQMTANQLNALKSTGPGRKDRTKYNAVKHAHYSHLGVLKDENILEFFCLIASLSWDYDPIGTMEHILVKIIADKYWEYLRFQKIKAKNLEGIYSREHLEDSLEKNTRIERRVRRDLMQTIRDLTNLQTLRGKDFSKDDDRRKQNPYRIFGNIGFAGPQWNFKYSEGEAAVKDLQKRAMRVVQHMAHESGNYDLEKFLFKWADQRLAATGCMNMADYLQEEEEAEEQRVNHDPMDYYRRQGIDPEVFRNYQNIQNPPDDPPEKPGQSKKKGSTKQKPNPDSS